MFARSSRIITFILSFYVRMKLNNKVGKLNNNNRQTEEWNASAELSEAGLLPACLQ